MPARRSESPAQATDTGSAALARLIDGRLTILNQLVKCFVMPDTGADTDADTNIDADADTNIDADLDALYAALADPTRRGIIVRLREGEATVAELRRPFAMSAPAISKHLNVLESAGLIERRPAGRHRVCRLRGRELRRAERWIREQTDFWESTLDSLAEHLGEPPGGDGSLGDR